MIGASGSRSFEIRGANLTNYESVRCQFVKTITNQVHFVYTVKPVLNATCIYGSPALKGQ